VFSATGKRLVFSRNPRVFEFFPTAQQASFWVFLESGGSKIAFFREFGYFLGLIFFSATPDARRIGIRFLGANFEKFHDFYRCDTRLGSDEG
jgi:hypothetical protein